MIRKEDCDEETLERISKRVVDIIMNKPESLFTPENIQAIIQEEYIRQMIRTGEGVIIYGQPEGND